jgi:hypothetical protein
MGPSVAQSIVYVKVPSLVGVTISPPLRLLTPFQSPLAMQFVAPDVVQVKVVDSPKEIEVSVLEKFRTGGLKGLIITSADALMLPPAPLQINE